jgi:hypothetical protein
MKYPLPLARALFTATTIILTMTVTNGADCTPFGKRIKDDETNGQCPGISSNIITKKGFGILLGQTELMTS